MAWSGGVFTRTNGTYSGASVWASDQSASISIVSSRHDTHDLDLATGINNCITKDGQNTPTANLPMGGYKHTNVSDASSRSDYAKASQVQDSAYRWLGTLGGGTTDYTASLTPSLTAYTAGQVFHCLTPSINAVTPTLNINSLGIKSIRDRQGAALAGSNWTGGQWIILLYDGSNFRFLG